MTVEGTPRGDASPPFPQRATPARKGARCGAGAGSPRPRRPHLGHTGRGTPATRPRGRAAGGGTAPDTTRPSQRWQATPRRGRPPTTPTARSPHRACRPRGPWWAPTPTRPRPQHVGGGPQQPAQWAGSRGRGSARPQTPFMTVEGTPPGDALPPLPQRATPARKGARCGAGAGSPRPHRLHPGHTGRRTPAARPRGRAAGGGTAPGTRRPSQRWQASPPGDGPPPPPGHAAPTGHAGQGDSVGPPHSHSRAHSTWVADPNSPPSGRAVGGGGAPDLRRPSQQWRAPPPGTPFRHPHSEQRWPARAQAVEPVLGPRAYPDRTRNTRVAVPRLPAPEDGRSGEGQRLTPDAPHNSGRPPPPRGRPPTTPASRSPHRACRPSQVGGNRDRTAPPQASQTEQGTGAGHAEGHGPRAAALPAPSAGTARGAHATPPGGGGGGRTPRERERTHTHRARGDYQKGNRTELAERTDRVEWLTSERG